MKKARPKRLTKKQMAARMRDMLKLDVPCGKCPASSPNDYVPYSYSGGPQLTERWHKQVCQLCRTILGLDPSLGCPCSQIPGNVEAYVLERLEERGL